MSDIIDVKDQGLDTREEEARNPPGMEVQEQLIGVVAVESNDCVRTPSALIDTKKQTDGEKAVDSHPMPINSSSTLPEIDSSMSGVSLNLHSKVAEKKEDDVCEDTSLSPTLSPDLLDKNEAAKLNTNEELLKSEKCDDNYQNVASTAPDPCSSSPLVNEGSFPSQVNFDDNIMLKTEVKDDDAMNDSKQESENLDIAETTESDKLDQTKLDVASIHASENINKSFNLEHSVAEGYESGTEEEQAEFRKDVENFYRKNGLEFKAPKFYKEELNLLKLWRAVIKLGGYEQVTSSKLWRQVGESFRPPKTCTTVSWTFRIFYEKALFEYEKQKLRSGELPFSDNPFPEAIRAENQATGNQALSSGRARRDAAARAMQGWHSQRLLDNGEVCHPIIKNKNLSSFTEVDKQSKANGYGLLKRKRSLGDDSTTNTPPVKAMKSQSDTSIIDIGPPADWVKINVQKTSDCYEIYALVPGLLREEVHVQSDPAGRIIISGQPEQVDNPWGITPFKKVVGLPSRIDPYNTSAVVTLHGQLFVRVPFESAP